MGKKVLGTILLIGLGAAVTLGAIRAFGTNEHILPEDEKVVEKFTTITYDDLINKSSRYTHENYGSEVEVFTYVIDEEKDISCVVRSSKNNEGNYSLSENKQFHPSYFTDIIALTNYDARFIDVNVLSNEENYSVRLYANEAHFDEITSNLSAEHIFYYNYSTEVTAINSFIQSFIKKINDDTSEEKIDYEVVSFDIYGLKYEQPEVTPVERENEFTIDFTNNLGTVELTNESLQKWINKKDEIVSLSDETTDQIAVYRKHGGLFLDSTAVESESSQAQLALNMNEDFAFNRYIIKARAYAEYDKSDKEYALTDKVYLTANGTSMYMNSNALDVEKDTTFREIYMAIENSNSITFSASAPIIIESITFWYV